MRCGGEGNAGYWLDMEHALSSLSGGTILLSSQWATDALNWTSGPFVFAFLVAYLVVLGLVCI